MRDDLRTAARILVVPTLALVTVAVFLPGRAGLSVRVYALVVCAVAIGIALSALRRALPPAGPLLPSATRLARPRPPATLSRLESDAALGVAGTFDLHHRLRPRLRALARELLAMRRGISLDDDPESARLALGDLTWDLVRSDRPPPADRLARGLTLPALNEVVEALEGL
ncbi:MAG TPA: hypothetical protein VK926_08140 [Gaiellaceae bacterium]|nr:hypothetical protein [Gaiellaceae bacterium]